MRRAPRQIASHTGFTLVELIIVMVIIGVLASMAYKSYQKHVEAAHISGLTTRR